jgi:AcrR family transcriptional regulator
MARGISDFAIEADELGATFSYVLAARPRGWGMRNKIKSLATDLLIQRGYQGVSFGDLAQELDITRANIHYHFGNKEKLVEEVLDDYVQFMSARLNEIWTNPKASLREKIANTVAFSRKRYETQNPSGKGAQPWSLISRMRQDSDLLNKHGRDALKRFSALLFDSIVSAIEKAKENGELSGRAPVDEVALLLVSIANSAGAITRDSGSFDRLEQLYMGFARILMDAYGKQATTVARRTRRSKNPALLTRASA